MSKTHQNSQSEWLAALETELQQRRARQIYRELREVTGAQGPTLQVNGQEYLQFSTNNYLNLANDPEVVAATREALERFGAGAGASRLVAGSMELHHRLEEELARFKGTERALIFPTGFMANLGVLTTFSGAGDGVVSDKLNHASLLDAAKYSGADCRTFPHRDYERARALLEKNGHRDTEAQRGNKKEKEEETRNAKRETRNNEEEDGKRKTENGGQKFLVTDSVFSMDGDVADLGRACEVAEENRALVVIDEAHATGVLGKHGKGLAELQGVENRVAITVGTLSKALGSVGGFVCGAREVIETLINSGRAFIYTTALPPACSAASLVALKIVQSEEGRRRRERVMKLAAHVRAELRGMGFDCGDSVTPIVPVILGSAEKALAAAEKLKEEGIWVPAIRPPTVGRNLARLRISLMSGHNDEHVERLVEGMRDVQKLELGS